MKKSIWLTPTPNTQAGCDELVDRLADAGFEQVIPMAKLTDGSMFYHSRIGPVREEFRDFDPLRAICRRAGRRGLAVFPRVCVFPDAPSGELTRRDPSVRCVGPDGGIFAERAAPGESVWLCPRRPEVQDHELRIFEEILTEYPVDGLHMDFIRYPQREACFCPVCRDDYRKRFASDIRDIANERENPDYRAALAWRAEPVTCFVRRLREATRRRGSTLSAAVFHAWPNALCAVGQDWPAWCSEGLLDSVYPMTYVSDLRIMGDYTRMQRMLSGSARLWQGLFRFPWMSAAECVELARAAAGAGAEGIAVFRYDYLKDDDWPALTAL